MRWIKLVRLSLAGVASRLPMAVCAPIIQSSTTNYNAAPGSYKADDLHAPAPIIKDLLLFFMAVIILMAVGKLGIKMANSLFGPREHGDGLDQIPSFWFRLTSGELLHFEQLAKRRIEEGKATNQSIHPNLAMSSTSSVSDKRNIITIVECPGLYGTMGFKEDETIFIYNPLFIKK